MSGTASADTVLCRPWSVTPPASHTAWTDAGAAGADDDGDALNTDCNDWLDAADRAVYVPLRARIPECFRRLGRRVGNAVARRR